MPLNADAMIDRLRMKQQITRWRVIAIVIAVLALIVVTESHTGGNIRDIGSPVQASFIARVTIDGFVTDDKEKGEKILAAGDNDKAKALIVWINTPGGSVVGGEELYYNLRSVAGKKPVVAVVRSMATSAGYMAAIGADHIVAREGSVTGSIGVLMESVEITEMAKSLGITPITIKSTPLKGSPGLLEKTTPEAEHAIKVVIDDIYESFVKMVAERRNLPMDEAYALADGRVYSGRQALKRKLIDQIGGEEEALAWLSKNKQIDATLDIRDIDKKPKNIELLEKFMDSASRKIFGSHTSTLDGVTSIWHPSLQIQ